MDLNEFPAKRMINESKYAQKPRKTDRLDDKIDEKCRYNDYTYKKFISRNEFSRDKDRIIFSRAFRRLQHKAQVYSFERGDHFRTRLTHTLEVVQIACSISENLGLNSDLTEAIALGHDIGHAPYGHQGERILDEIMSGETDLGGKLGHKIYYGGFKHNYNSLRILDVIEHKYKNKKGLNLTWQVMEGILKHTKIKKKDKNWDIDRFMLNKQKILQHLNYEFSVTLEGQVVAIADEIAQRQHDLDDGMRDDSLRLSYDDVSGELKKHIYEIETHYGMEPRDFLNLILNLKEKIQIRKKENELFRKDSLIRDIIEYFICDVTINSMENIQNNAENCLKRENDIVYFNKSLISFSKIGEKLNEKILNYINQRIVNSYGVNRFDGKAVYILKQLFKAYYENPRQMPNYALDRLSRDIRNNCVSIYDLKFEDGEKIRGVNFSRSSSEDIEKLISLLKLKLDL